MNKSYPIIQLSVRQTGGPVTDPQKDVIFPFISAKTIASWIAAGVLIPSERVLPPAGPGKGSKLDFPDECTVGFLSSIFAAGGRLKSFSKPDGEEGENSTVRFQKPLKDKNSVGWGPDKVPFSKTVEYDDLVPGTRQIQQYLKRHQSRNLPLFQVFACVEILRPIDIGEPYLVLGTGGDPQKETVSRVTFFPKADLAYYLDIVSNFQPYERITFVNAEHWADYVKSRLHLVEHAAG